MLPTSDNDKKPLGNRTSQETNMHEHSNNKKRAWGSDRDRCNKIFLLILQAMQILVSEKHDVQILSLSDLAFFDLSELQRYLPTQDAKAKSLGA